MGKKKGVSDNVRNRKKNRSQVRVNPFEVKVNKVKHVVVNKRVQKWEKGAPGVSRSKAIKKRKDTLLRELHHMGKANFLHDKRFGENDTNLTADEKMVQRFAMEKKKQSQKGSFNLNEDEEESLTHYGQSLAENLQDEIGSDSDDDTNQMRTGDLQFGGFSNNEQMSYKDKMNEVIAESKKLKFERQAEKEKNIESTNELDCSWKSVVNILNPLRRDARPAKPTSSYMQLFHNLVMEQKSVGATDKTKTEEEIAKEEAEKLQTLEAERLSRMMAPSESDRPKHISADDLNDCFALDKKEKKVLRFSMHPKDDDEEEENADSENADSENDDEEVTSEKDEEDAESDDDDESDEEQSDHFSDLASDAESSEDDTESENKKKSIKPILKKSIPKTESSSKDGDELPYIFSAPGSFAELEALLHGHNNNEQTMIISRLRKCHHPSLAEGNKDKLEKIQLFLLQYFGKLAAEHEVNQVLINSLTAHIWEMMQMFKSSTANALQKYILQRQKEHSEFVEKKGRGVFPQKEMLLHLSLVETLFPTSDFRHPVVTSAFHFITQMLAECPPRSYRDISTGLFLCSIALKYVSLSKRYIPEVVTYIQGILTLAYPLESLPKKDFKNFPPFKQHSKVIGLLVLNGPCKDFPENLLVSKISSTEEKEVRPNYLICHSVNLLLNLMTKCLDLWRELPSISSIIEPWVSPLKALPLTDYPDSLKTKITTVLESLTSLKPTLKLMQQPTKKPVALKLFEPRIEETWSGKKKKGGSDKTVNEKQRLTHKHRRELKAAVREIKRDNEVLAKHKLDTVMKSDAERKRKMKELMHGLAVQEGDYKAMKRYKKD